MLQYRDSLQAHPELAKMYRELAAAAASTTARKVGSESGAPGEEAVGAKEGQAGAGAPQGKDKEAGAGAPQGKDKGGLDETDTGKGRALGEADDKSLQGREAEDTPAQSGLGKRGGGVASSGPVVDVLVPREYATTTNRQVGGRAGQGTRKSLLWLPCLRTLPSPEPLPVWPLLSGTAWA